MMFRSLLLGAFLSAQTALAGGIAVVDFNKAGSLVREGAKIQADLEQLAADRKQRITEMQAEFQAKVEAYQKQQMILSEETRAQKETELGQMQQELQQARQTNANMQAKDVQMRPTCLDDALIVPKPCSHDTLPKPTANVPLPGFFESILSSSH